MIRIIGLYHAIVGIVIIISTYNPEAFGYYVYNSGVLSYLIGGVFIFLGYLTFQKIKIGILGLMFFTFLQVINFRVLGMLYEFRYGLAFLFDIKHFDFSFHLLKNIQDLPVIFHGFFNCFGDGSYFSINILSALMLFFLTKKYNKFH